MSKTGGGSTNTITQADPWSGVQPYLKDLYSQAGELYGQSPQGFFPGQTFAPQNTLQQQAQQMGVERAQGLDTSQTLQGTSRLLEGQSPLLGALSSPLQQVGGTYEQIMGAGPSDISAPQWSYTPGTGEQSLESMAQGGANPYLDQNVRRAQESMADVFNTKVLSNIRDQAQLSGQYGGSRQDLIQRQGTQDLMEAMGNVGAQMYGSAYETDAARRLQASQALSGVQGQAQGMGLQYAGLGLEGQRAAEAASQGRAGQALQAAGSTIGGVGQGQAQASKDITMGLSMAPQAYQSQFIPSQILSGIGAEQQGYTQQGINEAMQRYYYPQQQQAQNLAQYTNILGGIGLPSSTNTSQMLPPANRLGSAVGGGTLGYGLAQGTSLGGPWGALLGAGLGYAIS